MAFAFVVLTFATADQPKVIQAEDFERLRGQVSGRISRAELRKRLGKPKHVSRQFYHQHFREQWYYDVSPGWLIELKCPVGVTPTLFRVIPISPPSR